MDILFVGIFGLLLGSFVNALVWRIREQSKISKKHAARASELSVTKGRSMCPHCRHELAPKDLIPLFSWLALRGKCRYCHKAIGWQYPVVELATGLLFVISYIYWPESRLSGVSQYLHFGVWLVMLTGFIALVIYDLKWMLLPNRIVYPLMLLAGALAAYDLAVGAIALVDLALSVAIAGGIFYLLFMVSDGKWIGGGDVKLGTLIGLLLADPYLAFFALLLASVLGTLFVLPGMVLRKVTASSRIPFGPFLIAACVLVFFFGATAIEWYKDIILLQ